MRFASHRDFSRAFERAVVRSRVPVAYSSGFHPHPRISYAGAAPTGAASEAEYLELALAQRADPDLVRTALLGSLPDGLDVVAVAESSGGALGDLLTASRWRVDLSDDLSVVEPAVRTRLAASAVSVTRMTKRGERTFDCREAVVSLGVARGPGDRGVRLDLVLAHTVPAVRPDDVVSGMRAASGWAPSVPPLLTRLAQGTLDPATGCVSDLLGPCDLPGATPGSPPTG